MTCWNHAKLAHLQYAEPPSLHLPVADWTLARERCKFARFDHAAAVAGHLFLFGLLISSPALTWQMPAVTVTEKLAPASVPMATPACKMLRQSSLTVAENRKVIVMSTFRKARSKNQVSEMQKCKEWPQIHSSSAVFFFIAGLKDCAALCILFEIGNVLLHNTTFTDFLYEVYWENLHWFIFFGQKQRPPVDRLWMQKHLELSSLFLNCETGVS